MSESWKSKGHYLKDGTEWKGDQHATRGKVMTGKSHTGSSKILYHFIELTPDARKKVLSRSKK